MTRLIVDTRDLRQALAAVGPHMGSPRLQPELARVHCRVEGPNLVVTATNTVSAALAIVSMLENEHGEASVFDLYPTELADLLGGFKASDPKEELGDTLRVEETDVPQPSLRITDVSGLWPGKSLTLPRDAVMGNAFPDIGASLATLLRQAEMRMPHVGDVVANGGMLGLFGKAARSYGCPLIVEVTGDRSPVLVIACGESFVGFLATIVPSEDAALEQKRWRSAWFDRLTPFADAGE